MRLDRLLLTVGLLAGSVFVAAPAGADDDVDPPQVVILTPMQDEQITRGGSVIFDYECMDEVDPTPTCEATVTGDVTVPDAHPPSGGGWDFAEVGNFTVQVDSQDASGNQSSMIVQFSVVDALCNGQVVTVLVQTGEQPTAGPDVIQAPTNYFDLVEGLGGNDVICGGDAKNLIDGGPGNDRILGGPQRDHLFGGTGNDRIEGRGGNDRLEGDEGTDTLLGGTEADRIEGGSGNDSVNGGPQADSCHGQEGTRDTKAQCEVFTGFP